jgi:hypothetical protein
MRRTRVISAVAVLFIGVLAVWMGTAALGDDDEATTDGPVIAVVDWTSYPAAEISGQLRLVEGCLLIGKSVVFWAEGTSWDAANSAVTFEDAEPVRVGDNFSGGGGHYSGGNVDGLDGVDVEAVSDCLRLTGSDDAVIAAPSR